MRNAKILLLVSLVLPLAVGAYKAKPFTPYRIELTNIEVTGELSRGFFDKDLRYQGRELFTVEESARAGLRDYSETYPRASIFYRSQRTDTEQVIAPRVALEVESGDVVLCYHTRTGTEDCGKKVSFDWKDAVSVSVLSNSTWNSLLQKEEVSINDEVRAELAAFRIRGDVSGSAIKITGAFLYDNSPEARASFERGRELSDFIYNYVPVILIGGILLLVVLLPVVLIRFIRRVRQNRKGR